MNLNKGKCLNCGEPTDSMFCEKCDPDRQPAGSVDEWFDDTSLPVEMEQDTIAGMIDGEIAYVVHWAMFADPYRKLFMIGTYSTHRQPGGTVALKIQKARDEILVDMSTIGNYKYTPTTPYYVGVKASDFIPARLVKQIKG